MAIHESQSLSFEMQLGRSRAFMQLLADKGVKIPVLVIHQGGFQTTGAALNGCAGNLAGSDIAAIADRLDPAIKVIVSAHTHAEYRCTYTSNGVTRLITSASNQDLEGVQWRMRAGFRDGSLDPSLRSGASRASSISLSVRVLASSNSGK